MCMGVFIWVSTQLVCEYIAKYAQCINVHTTPHHANGELEYGKKDLEVILGVERRIANGGDRVCCDLCMT